MPMIDFSMRLLGACFGLASALASAETVDLARIDADLAPENTAFIKIEANFDPIVHHCERHLIVGEFHKQGNYRSARVFSKIFGARHDVGAWLNTLWHGLPMAGYNGLAFDRDERPLANVKFVDVRPTEPYLTERLVGKFMTKINRFAGPSAWSDYILRTVRSDHGFDRRDESVASLDISEAYLPRYENYVAITRRMMKFLDVRGDREGWIVVRYDGGRPPDEELEAMRFMVERSPYVRGIVLMTRFLLLTVTAEGQNIEELEFAESRLGAGERSFDLSRY